MVKRVPSWIHEPSQKEKKNTQTNTTRLSQACSGNVHVRDSGYKAQTPNYRGVGAFSIQLSYSLHFHHLFIGIETLDMNLGALPARTVVQANLDLQFFPYISYRHLLPPFRNTSNIFLFMMLHNTINISLFATDPFLCPHLPHHLPLCTTIFLITWATKTICTFFVSSSLVHVPHSYIAYIAERRYTVM